MQVRQTIEGRYALLDELGSGGMAVVWRARDEVLGRQVAVKLLAGRYADDPQSRARIRDEARAAATLSHPNIAQVYDYGEAVEDGTPRPYVVMELVNGPTLQQRLASGPLPPRTVFRICGEVAAALAAAHADGLVHRDIKMANIMVTPAGAKVVDFGIAAAVGPAAPEDMLVGTPAYLAPERLTGEVVLPASDVYALGVLLYRLLAHESPWSVESTTQMLQAHVYVEPAPLPETAGVPPAIADLVGRCLRKDPAERPSASEVSATLGDAAEAADAVRVRNGEPPAPGTGPGSIAEAVGVAGGGIPAPAAAPVAEEAETPGAGHDGAVGDGGTPVPVGKRKYLLAGGVAAALVLGILLVWPALGGGDSPGRERAASTPAVVGPAATGGAPSPAVSGGRDGATPAVPALPAPVPVVGSASAVVAGSPAQPAASTAGAVSNGPGPQSSGSPEPSPSAAPEGTRLASPGGVVFAVCESGNATLTWWQAADGFTVEQVEPGPALAARILFAGSPARYRTTVTCVAGKPAPVVLPL